MLNWSTKIYNNMIWTKIKLGPMDRLYQAKVDTFWNAANDRIPWIVRDIMRTERATKHRKHIFKMEMFLVLVQYYGDVQREVSNAMLDSARYMQGAADRAFLKSLPDRFWRKTRKKEAEEDLIPYVESEPGDYMDIVSTEMLGKELDAWAATAGQKTLEKLQKTFTIGLSQGYSMDQIAKLVQDDLTITRHSAKMMTRTAIQSAANEMQRRCYKANEDLMKGYQYTATLDVRTCSVCGGYDGQTFSKASFRPVVPLHIGCRCTYVPIMKSAAELGLGPLEMPTGMRASMNGAVPDTTDYETWIAQPENAAKLAAYQRKLRQKYYKKAKAKKKKLQPVAAQFNDYLHYILEGDRCCVH